MAETLPQSLQKLVLTGFDIRPAANVAGLAGLVFHSEHGTALFVATRRQLLDLADECRRAAEAMPKPS